MKQNTDEQGIGFWKVLLLASLALSIIFAVFTARDTMYLKKTIRETFDFMQGRLAACESYEANDEAKSLMGLMDKAIELSRVIEVLKSPEETVMQAYLKEQRLSSILVLDGTGKIVAQFGEELSAQQRTLLQSDAVQDIADHPEKVYFSRIQGEDGYCDVAASSRRDEEGVLFLCSRHQNGVSNSGDFSLQSLFTGFTFDMNGVVAVSDGKTVVNSNLESLQGKSLEESRTLYNGEKAFEEGTITRLTGRQGIWYGSKKRVRSYDLYVFFPAAQVYKTRTIALGCSLVIMVLAWLMVLMQRDRTERAAMEQSQKRLRIINALGTAYSAIMLVQLTDQTVEVYRSSHGNYENYRSPMTGGDQREQIAKYAAPEYRESLKEFSDIATMPQRLRGRDFLSYTWKTSTGGWMTSLVVPQRWDDKGNLAAVLVANRDVTEEKQREQEAQRKLEKTAEDARRANAAKTDFLRRMSHDVRTPINGIQGMVEISRHYIGNEVKQEECRQKILDASGFLLDLVNNVLDMNKLESGEIQLEEVPFDLEKLVRETNSVIEIQAGERGVALHDHGVRVEHTHLIGSPLHLRQVMQNIESNAVKYTPEGGSVTVGCNEVDSENGIATLEFVCSDTGIGMSKEFQKHAFEPFAQENANARTAYSGTGLGLAITKELVEQMGGTIEFRSRPGSGTTFVVQLPLRIDAKADAQKEQSAQPQAGSIRGAKVLLVEDNELNMEIAQFLLESEGAVVTQAWNGREAVELFAASEPNSYDVILMDVMMPLMGGLEATRIIRGMKRQDAATVPIFAMTANAFQDDIQRSRAAGMNEHLTKPLDAKELLTMIARYRSGTEKQEDKKTNGNAE